MTQTVTRKRLRNKSSDVGEEKERIGIEERLEGRVKKKQIFQGLMKNFAPLKLDILILAEFWPSVVVGMEINPTCRLWIHCPQLPTLVRGMLPSRALLIDRAEVAEIIGGSRMDAAIIQGSGKYCNQVLSSYGQELSGVKLFIVLPATRLRAFECLRAKIGKWYKLKHELIGGVTNSRWLIGVGKSTQHTKYPPLEELCATVGLERQFGDIIKTAARGTVCEPSLKSLPTLLSLDLASSREEFQLPCVMSRTGWVKRPLITQELGALFDFPELYMNELTGKNEETMNKELDFMFNIHTIPIKIVSILRSLIGELNFPGQSKL